MLRTYVLEDLGFVSQAVDKVFGFPSMSAEL
jgi:hypothetical protein